MRRVSPGQSGQAHVINNTETPPRHSDDATPPHSRVQAGGTEANLRHLPLLTTVVKSKNITLPVWRLTVNNVTVSAVLCMCVCSLQSSGGQLPLACPRSGIHQRCLRSTFKSLMKMYCREFVLSIGKTKLCLSLVLSVPHVRREILLSDMYE